MADAYIYRRDNVWRAILDIFLRARLYYNGDVKQVCTNKRFLRKISHKYDLDFGLCSFVDLYFFGTYGTRFRYAYNWPVYGQIARPRCRYVLVTLHVLWSGLLTFYA